MTKVTEQYQQQRPTNQEVGALGESLAARFLEQQGYVVRARNWRHPRGELDLVVEGVFGIVAVEVKTRRGNSHGKPLEAITADKVARLRRLLVTWVRSQQIYAPAIRVDAIGITLYPDRPPHIEHVENVQ